MTMQLGEVYLNSAQDMKVHSMHKSARPEDARKTAEEFESLFLNQMFKVMFETIDVKESLFSGGHAEEVWRREYVKNLAEIIAQNGGIGLSDTVYTQMVRLQEESVSPYIRPMDYGEKE